MTKPRRVTGRRNVQLNQDKRGAAKAARGAISRSSAVDATLELIDFRTEVFQGLDALAKAGGFEPAKQARRTAR